MVNSSLRRIRSVILAGLMLVFLATVSPPTMVGTAMAQPACGTSVELVANGGFETPVLEGGNQTLPFTPDSGWEGGLQTNTSSSSGSQSAVAVGGAGGFSQTLDTTGLGGTTLSISFMTASGGYFIIGGESHPLPWHGGTFSPFTTTYNVTPNETATTIVFTAGSGNENGGQINIDDVSVTGIPNPCPTPTLEPTTTPIPTLTPEPTATVEPTLVSTEGPTATTDPGASTGDAIITILTDDGGDIPDSTTICILDGCVTADGADAGAAASAAAASGTSYVFSDLVPGTYPVSIFDAAPYDDAEGTITIEAGTTTEQVYTLVSSGVVPTEPGNATPITTEVPNPTTPPTNNGGSAGGPSGGSGGSVPVKALPNTGAGNGEGTSSLFLLLSAMLLTTFAGATLWRRRIR